MQTIFKAHSSELETDILQAVNDTLIRLAKGASKNIKITIAIDDDEPSKAEVMKNLKKGFEEVSLFKKGKLKTTPAKDFLNEL